MSYIVTGERIQEMCDIYLGEDADFNWNPVINKQKSKHVYLERIVSEFNNPYYVFCYTHQLHLLSKKIHFLKNKFILITHNSDGQIEPTDIILYILKCDNLIRWYGQNVCFEHPKLFFIPIGLANSQWKHGNLSLFYNTEFIDSLKNKKKRIYFNFKVDTNKTKRQICYDKLKNNLEWLTTIEPEENIKRLAEYEFCICPEGNGVDTHRLWECIYLKVVPIVIKSASTDILKKNNIPLCILDSWDSLDETKLNYKDFDFTCVQLSVCNLQILQSCVFTEI